MVNANIKEKLSHQKRAIYFITLKGNTHSMTTQSQTTRNAKLNCHTDRVMAHVTNMQRIRSQSRIQLSPIILDHRLAFSMLWFLCIGLLTLFSNFSML